MLFLHLHAPITGSDSAPSHTNSADSESTNPVTVSSPAICDNGGTSDISAWTESEEDSQMQIFSHSEGNENTEYIQDSNEDLAGPKMVSTENNDVFNIGHLVEMIGVEPQEGMSGSGALSQSSTHHTAALDEDVRVFVPSTPE